MYWFQWYPKNRTALGKLKIASTAMFIRNSSFISVFANNGYEKRRKWFEWGKELKVRYMYCRIRIRVIETIQFSILTASNYIICKCNYIFFILAWIQQRQKVMLKYSTVIRFFFLIIYNFYMFFTMQKFHL